MEENTQIELRSEKVRNIIGQVPSVLLRYGISIIGISLLMLVAIAAFIPYQPSFSTEIKVTQDTSSTLLYTANIPHEAIKQRSQFVCITINTESEFPFPRRFRIESISDTVQISQNGIWHTASISQMDTFSNEVQLESPITIPAKIMLERQSILKWTAGKIISTKF